MPREMRVVVGEDGEQSVPVRLADPGWSYELRLPPGTLEDRICDLEEALEAQGFHGRARDAELRQLRTQLRRLSVLCYSLGSVAAGIREQAVANAEEPDVTRLLIALEQAAQTALAIAEER